MDTAAMDCINVGIVAYPLNYPPEEPPPKAIPDKLLKILRKYKYNWRLDQLSKPNRICKKYVSKEEGMPLRFEKREVKKLDEETLFYSDQLATPTLKNLVHNKIHYGKISKTLNRKLRKNLKKAWGSIYNYYRRKERCKRLRQKRREAEQNKGKEKPKTFERCTTLAIPKKLYKPPPREKSKIFDGYDRLDVLASPKVYIIQPPKRVGVNPAALTYEPTEVVFRLAKLPKRFENLPKQLEPGAVRRAALRYKVTPRIEALCVPKSTKEKAKDDDDFDPWAIPKNALKYKATPRIMELAKPLRE